MSKANILIMREKEEFVVRIELTETEKARLIALAARSGMTVDEYVKRALGYC